MLTNLHVLIPSSFFSTFCQPVLHSFITCNVRGWHFQLLRAVGKFATGLLGVRMFKSNISLTVQQHLADLKPLSAILIQPYAFSLTLACFGRFVGHHCLLRRCIFSAPVLGQNPFGTPPAAEARFFNPILPECHSHSCCCYWKNIIYRVEVE